MRNFWIIPFLFIATTASASYSGYTYQRIITISSTNVQSNGGNLTNFPVLISTNAVTLSTTSATGGHLATTTGLDLVFSTMSDCSFLLNWDTETVQGVGVSTMNAWVQVPTLTTATLTAATFYMCYGNSGITSYQGTSTKTWDNNYTLVYHLPNGTTLSANDSTGNANHGSLHNVSALSGKIDGAVSIANVTGDYIETPTLDLGNTFTIESWGNPVGINSNSPRIVENNYATGFFLGGHSADSTAWFIVNSEFNTFGGTLSLNTWSHLVGTFGSGTSTLYLNGSQTSTHGSISNPTIGSAVISIGDTRAHNDSNSVWNGSIDEVRISTSVRSADWIKTEYNNQNSPTTFVTIGPETQTSASTAGRLFSTFGTGSVSTTVGTGTMQYK
jgi:hypothetical protein